MQPWQDGPIWVRAQRVRGALGLTSDRSRPLKQVMLALCGIAALISLLFLPALVAELRLLLLQQPLEQHGPVVLEPVEVRRVALRQVAEFRPPIYLGDAVPDEKAEWAREAVRLAWREAPRITGLRWPGDELPIFLFADHAQYVAKGRGLWGQRFAELGWETCVFVGGRAIFGDQGIACDVSQLNTRESFYAALTHEVAHQLVFAEYMRGGSIPRWYDEGLAQYVAARVAAVDERTATLSAMVADNRIALALRRGTYGRLGDLNWRTSDDEFAAYLYARSERAISVLVARYGMSAVADVVRKAGPGRFDQTFAAVFGQDLDRFEAELETSLRAELLGPGRTMYLDDFALASGRWRRSWPGSADDRLGYAENELGLVATADADPVRAVWHHQVLGDYEATVTTRLTTVADQAQVFLDFHIQHTEERYRFAVSPNQGQFVLSLLTPWGDEPLIGPSPTAAAMPGTATNRLGVRLTGAEIGLYINGTLVGHLVNAYFDSGRFGFGVASGESRVAEARFRDLIITSVD